MVKPFQFARIPNIYFRNGIVDELPRLAGSFGNKALIVTGKHSFRSSLFADKLFHDLQEAGIQYYMISVPGEPSPVIVDQEVKRFFNNEINRNR